MTLEQVMHERDKMVLHLAQEDIEKFHTDGVVLIKGLFDGYVDKISEAIEENLASPGPYAAENVKQGGKGRFFDDYCNWQRIPALQDILYQSDVAAAAAQLMQSSTAQFFHDHILVKEAGTHSATPWHQDSPYYCVEGRQTVSFWTTVEPVTEATLRCVKGSHRWEKPVLPTRWLSGENFYVDTDAYIDVPDPDAEQMDIAEYPLMPGDAIAFDFKILHGARGNNSADRRRALSLRFVGDDAVFTERPGRTSPPFPNHNMQTGQKLRTDWFPILYSDSP